MIMGFELFLGTDIRTHVNELMRAQVLFGLITEDV